MSNRHRSSSVNEGVKGSTVGKFLQDKFKIGFSIIGKDEVKQSVLKATALTNTPPKEKHVRSFIAIKTLQVFHRCIQEAHLRFTEEILSRGSSKVLNLAGFRDTSSAPAIEHQEFIRQYARFLEERVLLYRNTNIRQLSPKVGVDIMLATVAGRRREETEGNKATNLKHLFKLLEGLQGVMSELLQLHVTYKMLTNPATLGAFSLILQDSFSLYKMLTESVIRLLDLFFSMNSSDASRALDLYKLHIEQTNNLISLYEFAAKCPNIRANMIPKLKPIPESVMDSMKQYIQTGRVPDEIARQVKESVFTTADEKSNKALDFSVPRVHNTDTSGSGSDDDVPTADLSEYLSEKDLANLSFDEQSSGARRTTAPTNTISSNGTNNASTSNVRSAGPTNGTSTTKKAPVVDDLLDFGHPQQTVTANDAKRDAILSTLDLVMGGNPSPSTPGAYPVPNTSYGAPTQPSPYAVPPQHMNPYGMPPQPTPYGMNPYGQPQRSPYAVAPQPNPYAMPPQANPYAVPPQANPYAMPPQSNPYAMPPQQQQQRGQSNNPFDDPF